MAIKGGTMDDCTLGVQNQTRIGNIEKKMDEFGEAINDIRDRLLGRPSWIITVLFAMMSSTVVGLLMKVVAMTPTAVP
jgi:hypothetical protein